MTVYSRRYLQKAKIQKLIGREQKAQSSQLFCRISRKPVVESESLRDAEDDAPNAFFLFLLQNHLTYAVLLDALCSNQQLSKAIELLREMKDKKLELNIVVYAIIIEGLLKAAKVESATEVFSSLSSKVFQPNVWTYNVMIRGLCNDGLLVEAEKLFREMKQKGCSADGCTYNTIIRGFFINNEASRAMGLTQEMVERGFSADASTMELLVNLLSKDRVDPALLPLLKNS